MAFGALPLSGVFMGKKEKNTHTDCMVVPDMHTLNDPLFPFYLTLPTTVL